MRYHLPIVLPALLLVACSQGEPAAPKAAALAPGMVVIEAPISHMALQHPMSSDPATQHKAVSYVKVDGREVTVYADTRISCPAKARLTGTWTSASGDKGGQHVEERHFVAVKWECIP